MGKTVRSKTPVTKTAERNENMKLQKQDSPLNLYNGLLTCHISLYCIRQLCTLCCAVNPLDAVLFFISCCLFTYIRHEMFEGTWKPGSQDNSGWNRAQDLFLAGLVFKSGSDKGSEQVTLGFIQLGFENLHAGILHNLLGQFVPHYSSCVKALSWLYSQRGSL